MNRYHGLTAGFEAGEIFLTYRSIGGGGPDALGQPRPRAALTPRMDRAGRGAIPGNPDFRPDFCPIVAIGPLDSAGPGRRGPVPRGSIRDDDRADGVGPRPSRDPPRPSRPPRSRKEGDRGERVP
jgi:hypothetical protein